MSKTKIIKMFGGLLLALFLIACNKEDTSPAFIRYNPPDCPKGFDELYHQPDNRRQVFTEDAFSLTKYNGYTGPEGIFGFPEPEVSLQKGHWEKVSGRYSVARGHIKVPNDGEVEISGKLTLSKTPGGIEGEIGLWVGQEEEVNQKIRQKSSTQRRTQNLLELIWLARSMVIVFMKFMQT